MCNKLLPDFIFENYSHADVNFMVLNGFSSLILDVDNTLEPYENPLPTKEVISWINDLKTAGITCAIVSNNSNKRIDLFNSKLNLVAYSKSKKPFKKYILKAMDDMGADPQNTVFMGDQIFTDVYGAHNAGIKAILVPPIKDKRDPFTRIKRLLEKPLIKLFYKRQKSERREQ